MKIVNNRIVDEDAISDKEAREGYYKYLEGLND